MFAYTASGSNTDRMTVRQFKTYLFDFFDIAISDNNTINDLITVGLLHDIGKIAIRDSILNKKGPLTDDEWKEIKRHPEISYRIISSVNDMADLAELVLYHHERWDGNGYPKGIKGDSIPMLARIITVADSYDAMTSPRPYRGALSKEVAQAEILANSGKQFDPEIADVFLKMINDKEK